MKNLELPAASSLTPAARASEITAILAAALIRSQTVDENSHIDVHTDAQRQTQLGFSPGRSVHTNPYQPESK